MNLIKWIVVSVISVAFFQPASAALLKEKDDYTILVYMIGSDMESDFHMASDDIQEMMDAGSSLNVNVVLQTGGAKMGEPVDQSQGESEVESRTSEAGAPRKYREDKYGQSRLRHRFYHMGSQNIPG